MFRRIYHHAVLPERVQSEVSVSKWLGCGGIAKLIQLCKEVLQVVDLPAMFSQSSVKIKWQETLLSLSLSFWTVLTDLLPKTSVLLEDSLSWNTAGSRKPHHRPSRSRGGAEADGSGILPREKPLFRGQVTSCKL